MFLTAIISTAGHMSCTKLQHTCTQELLAAHVWWGSLLATFTGSRDPHAYTQRHRLTWALFWALHLAHRWSVLPSRLPWLTMWLMSWLMQAKTKTAADRDNQILLPIEPT